MFVCWNESNLGIVQIILKESQDVSVDKWAYSKVDFVV